MSPKKWWHFLFLFILVGTLVFSALTALAISLVYPSLPTLEALTNYRPKLPLRVYSTEGELIGEFGEERRAFVKIEDVPKHMKDAVLAIEDRRFYQHNGIDTTGVLRAIKNNLTGKSHEGASTITMQVAKNFFSKPDAKRDMLIKIKEALLAIKIEKTLSKNQILELYLNQIYLGQRSYGFAAASQVYFAKPLKELNLAEAALLAGLPKAPSGYNPYLHEKRSIERQHEVLRDMNRYGFITKNEYDEAIKFPLKFKAAKTIGNLNADYVAEIVRLSMFQRYGEDIYQSGFKVYTTIKKQNQVAARAAVVQGIVEYELRQGFRGPEKNIQLSAYQNTTELVDKELADIETYNGFMPAIVISADKKTVKVVSKQGETIEISGTGIALIQKHLLNTNETNLAVKPGSLIRIVKLDGNWQVVQLPKVEASLIAINPQTGAVNALIGGFDFNQNKYNHVTQAWRQPGSSFKPFVYSAALEKGFTPASVVEDAPFSLSADEIGSKDNWEPHNYDEKYAGPIRLRTALTESKNMVSIRVLQSIGPRYAQNYITKFGFAAKDHPAYLAMALGSGSTTSWNLAAGYAVFANSGYQVKPYLISKIIDSDGKVVESVNPAEHISANRVIDPRNAFLMTSIMQDVIKLGTARRANVLGRSDLAGKTGTTNNQMDAWFAGFNPKEVAIAWMGYDTPKSLGKNETGGRAALPIWIKYMEFALKNTPIFQYKVPDGVVKLKIDAYNGTLANDFDDGIYEYFYQENPPPTTAVDFPALEDSTEPSEIAPSDSTTMITNPLRAENTDRPAPKAHAPAPAPVEEAKMKPANTNKPNHDKKPNNTDPTESAVRILNPDGY
ncbi:MAG TPA: penicillin-binding protein 1A [Methylophilaceae bacterium]|nr:penicillin-binding protein 1A [Methylophilaceae bacterium]